MFVEAFKELWLPILTICFILAISKITTYGGLSAAMGQGIAKAGGVFPILSPILGWIGVFMTGSVVNNNSLFAPIQASVAQQIGTSAPLLVGANTVGGVAAKLISPQSIAIATAAVKQVGKESELLKMTLKYSVAFIDIYLYLDIYFINVYSYIKDCNSENCNPFYLKIGIIDFIWRIAFKSLMACFNHIF